MPLPIVFGQIFKVGEVCKKRLLPAPHGLPASLGSTHYCEFSAAFCTSPANTSEIDPTEQKFTANLSLTCVPRHKYKKICPCVSYTYRRRVLNKIYTRRPSLYFICCNLQTVLNLNQTVRIQCSGVKCIIFIWEVNFFLILLTADCRKTSN